MPDTYVTFPPTGGTEARGISRFMADSTAPWENAPQNRQTLVDYARQAAQRVGIDPDVFERQINQESGFTNHPMREIQGPNGQVLHVGGVAQIVSEYHNVDPMNPQEALDYAANLMGRHMQTYGGDIRRALVAYNGGGGAVAAYDAGTPYQESQQYLNNIVGEDTVGGEPPASVEGEEDDEWRPSHTPVDAFPLGEVTSRTLPDGRKQDFVWTVQPTTGPNGEQYGYWKAKTTLTAPSSASASDPTLPRDKFNADQEKEAYDRAYQDKKDRTTREIADAKMKADIARDERDYVTEQYWKKVAADRQKELDAEDKKYRAKQIEWGDADNARADADEGRKDVRLGLDRQGQAFDQYANERDFAVDLARQPESSLAYAYLVAGLKPPAGTTLAAQVERLRAMRPKDVEDYLNNQGSPVAQPSAPGQASAAPASPPAAAAPAAVTQPASPSGAEIAVETPKSPDPVATALQTPGPASGVVQALDGGRPPDAAPTPFTAPAGGYTPGVKYDAAGKPLPSYSIGQAVAVAMGPPAKPLIGTPGVPLSANVAAGTNTGPPPATVMTTGSQAQPNALAPFVPPTEAERNPGGALWQHMETGAISPRVSAALGGMSLRGRGNSDIATAAGRPSFTPLGQVRVPTQAALRGLGDSGRRELAGAVEGLGNRAEDIFEVSRRRSRRSATASGRVAGY